MCCACRGLSWQQRQGGIWRIGVGSNHLRARGRSCASRAAGRSSRPCFTSGRFGVSSAATRSDRSIRLWLNRHTNDVHSGVEAQPGCDASFCRRVRRGASDQEKLERAWLTQKAPVAHWIDEARPSCVRAESSRSLLALRAHLPARQDLLHPLGMVLTRPLEPPRRHERGVDLHAVGAWG
jgi:hypothetical protein